MRRIGIFLALTILTANVLGQTNTEANKEVRALSLADCLQIALEHNLDVQIRRFNPEISRYNLGVAYGVYDPTFNASGGHDYSQSAGGIDPQGRPFGGTEIDANRFSAGFSGLLPWGLVYNLGGNMTDTYGTRPNVVQGTNIIGFSTNTIFDPLGNPIGNSISPNFDAVVERTPFENVAGSVGLLQLRQPLMRNFWIDNARLQIYLDKRNVKISELELRAQVITTVTDVETAYYNLMFAQESVKVQEAALELANRLVAENRKRVEVGALAPLDEKQAESQAAASKADLLAAIGTEDTQERVLKSLLSDDYSKWKNVSIKPSEAMVAIPETYDLQESWERGLKNRPDLLQQQLNVEKQNYVVKYQRNQLYPQLDLVGDYGLSASAAGLSGALEQLKNRENPFWSVGGQMSIPLGNTSARNNLKLAKATKEQMALELKRIEQAILIQIENAIATARTSFQRVDATREARIYAEAALGAEQKKLESGKSTSFEVLRLQRDLTSARSAEIRALADYNIALAQIALNEGSTLERRHVALEVK
jgi:outer membrane protein TolC